MSQYSIDNEFDEIGGLIDANRIAEASERLSRFLRAEPENARALYMKGCLHSQADEYAEAIECFESSAKYSAETSHLPLFNLGNLYKELGSWGHAAEAYNRALEVEPAMLDAWINLGCVIDNTGHHEEALSCYKVAEKIDGSDPMIFSNRGNSLRFLERYEEAEESYEVALEMDPTDFNSYVGLAVCVGHRDVDTGIDQLDDLHAQTGQAIALFEKAGLLANADRYREAATQYRELVELGMNEGPLWNNYAECLSKIDQPEEALQCFDRAIDLDPSSPNAYLGKARLLVNANRIGEARLVADKLNRVAPDELRTQESYAALLHALEY